MKIITKTSRQSLLSRKQRDKQVTILEGNWMTWTKISDQDAVLAKLHDENRQREPFKWLNN